MKKTVLAVLGLFHVASSEENNYHIYCPTGGNSWCKFNIDKAKSTSVYKPGPGIPVYIIHKIKPIYADLSKGSELVKCLHSKTQNCNESFNHLIWERLPKSNYVGLASLEFGVNDAVANYNIGMNMKCILSNVYILTPTNVDSLSINEEVLECLPDEVKIYLSADQIETDDINKRNNFPVEFLNSLTPSSMPPHCLKLKIRCVIMLLRNLDLKAGLCNGTRMKICALRNNYIDVKVLIGVSGGKRIFVNRIKLAPNCL
ncbi:uncharacterized protein LOC136083466 [Hydra vulgaris]|uniref:Uncharacterized protein LOC136083466 n=1 Tax=Hydra vulgaris TaxID=6087 RepID=A0ABM4CB86_HYDVU